MDGTNVVRSSRGRDVELQGKSERERERERERDYIHMNTCLKFDYNIYTTDHSTL